MEMRLACDMKIFAMQQVQLQSFRVSGPSLSRATWPKANSLQTDLAFYLALPFDFHFTFFSRLHVDFNICCKFPNEIGNDLELEFRIRSIISNLTYMPIYK